MIANGTNRVTARVGDPNEFSVSPGSSLFGDDEHSDPYQLSHAVQMCLVAKTSTCTRRSLICLTFTSYPPRRFLVLCAEH